ncbi:MAG: NTP transferase domain-containing protein [Acidobacteria bacterium]|nr:NTP transferase domain-containing protein [Acidobacteriota bacterium]
MKSTSMKGRNRGKRWAVILAGGDGERMRPLVTNWLGHPLPKQYCAFVGSRSMLQHTVDRARQLASVENIVTVIGAGHSTFLKTQRSKLHGWVVEQPENKDTGPGIFLPTTYVRSLDPDVTLIILPSDHFIFPEDRFIDYARRAAELAEQNRKHLVLLAARPRRPETQYGWIEAGTIQGSDLELYSVRGFHEKPSAVEAERFYRQGYLWNTMVMAVKVQTLWDLGRLYIPEVVEHFDLLDQLLRKSVPAVSFHLPELSEKSNGPTSPALSLKKHPSTYWYWQCPASNGATGAHRCGLLKALPYSDASRLFPGWNTKKCRIAKCRIAMKCLLFVETFRPRFSPSLQPCF